MKLITYHVDKSILLRQFLYERGISKKSLSAIKKNGALYVNGVLKTVRHQLINKDVVEIHLPEEKPSFNLLPNQHPLNILYEDEWIIAISKPAIQNTAPSREHPHGSLVESVLYYMNKNNEGTIPHIVTRLDRGTTGIVIFGKHQLIHHMLSQSNMTKIYVAKVEGILKKREGEIIAPIARCSDSIIKRCVDINGKFAHTKFHVINEKENFSLVKLQLFTGKTHQIRVHLSHIGHPIVGDTLYGTSYKEFPNQQLHCHKISFLHPITSELIEITDDVPFKL